jgi:hypothetical protein
MPSLPLLLGLGQGFGAASGFLKDYHALKQEEEQRRQQRLLQGLFTEEEVPAAPPIVIDPNNPQTLAHAAATARSFANPTTRDPKSMPPRLTRQGGEFPEPEPDLATGSLDPKTFALRAHTAHYVEMPGVRAPRDPSYIPLGESGLYLNPRKSYSFLVGSEVARVEAEAQRALEKYRHDLRMQELEHQARLQADAAATEAERGRSAGLGALQIVGVKVPEGADATLAPHVLDYLSRMGALRFSASLRTGQPDLEIGALLFKRQADRINRANQLRADQEVMFQITSEAEERGVPPDQIEAYRNQRIQEIVDREIPWTPEMQRILQQYLLYQEMLLQSLMGRRGEKTQGGNGVDTGEGGATTLPSERAQTLLPPGSPFNLFGGSSGTPSGAASGEMGAIGGPAFLDPDVRAVVDQALARGRSRDEIMAAAEKDPALAPYVLGIDLYLTQKGVR